MAAKTVLNYLDRDSVVHKMTGTTKLAFFLLFTFASMITYNTWVLLGLFAVSLAAFKLSKIKYREVRFMMIFMLVFLLLNNIFIFLFDPNQGTNLYGTRHVLCHLLWRYDVTAEQMFYMLNISLDIRDVAKCDCHGIPYFVRNSDAVQARRKLTRVCRRNKQNRYRQCHEIFQRDIQHIKHLLRGHIISP